MPPAIANRLPEASLTLVDYLLAALDNPNPRLLGGNTGLPEGAVEAPEHNLVLAPTPLERRIDETLLRFATATGRNVLLIRHGFHPEILDPVCIDVAVHISCGPILIVDTGLLRHRDGSLHLVPAKPDLFVEVTGCGLDLSMVAPWNRWDERAAGLEHAAAEIVRACRPRVW